MTNETDVEVYRLHVWIRYISPMIWRRILVRSDSSIAGLHYTLQIAFGWSDTHLNQFHIHGQDYGVYHDGGIKFSKNADKVRLSDFKFRINERFLYEYDFGDHWQHDVRIEARLALEDKRTYPCCTGGQRRSPPEDCGGSCVFMARRDEAPMQAKDLLEDLRDALEAKDMDVIHALTEDIDDLREWLDLDSFDRRAANRRLKQYATQDEAWMWS